MYIHICLSQIAIGPDPGPGCGEQSKSTTPFLKCCRRGHARGLLSNVDGEASFLNFQSALAAHKGKP